MAIKKEKIEVEIFECDRKECGRRYQLELFNFLEPYIKFQGKQYCSPHCLFKERFKEVNFIQLKCNNCKNLIKYETFLADGKHYCNSDCLMNWLIEETKKI